MNEFEKLVFEMRDCQKQFFATRNHEFLRRSKELEKKVDSYLENINSPKLFQHE